MVVETLKYRCLEYYFIRARRWAMTDRPLLVGGAERYVIPAAPEPALP